MRARPLPYHDSCTPKLIRAGSAGHSAECLVLCFDLVIEGPSSSGDVPAAGHESAAVQAAVQDILQQALADSRYMQRCKEPCVKAVQILWRRPSDQNKELLQSTMHGLAALFQGPGRAAAAAADGDDDADNDVGPVRTAIAMVDVAVQCTDRIMQSGKAKKCACVIY